MDLLLRRVLDLGARAAAPGEFTQRAFLNDKLDLAQAEAVADLVDSGSAQAARAALRSLQGEFSAHVHGPGRARARAAHVDRSRHRLSGRRSRLSRRPRAWECAWTICGERFAELAETARQGALLRDGLTVVIAGRPNAGKSSLLNRLAGYEAAIVTPIPGTTRDVLRERIAIDGLPLHILDTAGLRESPDAVEEEGIRRAHREISRADRVLFVIDSSDPNAVAGIEGDLAQLPAEVPRTLVFNKIDRSGEQSRIESGDSGSGRPSALTGQGTDARVYLCAVSGDGIDGLRAHLKDCIGFHPPAEGALSARTRHLDALRRARAHVETAHALLVERHAGELVAQELRDAHQDLGEITGEVSSDDLLGRIFSSFCIGK